MKTRVEEGTAVRNLSTTYEGPSCLEKNGRPLLSKLHFHDSLSEAAVAR